MIEQALFFAIGFLAAALAGVAAAPLLSRRAMRLAETRARLRAPATERQAIADADALRALHAVERVRLERSLALAEKTSAELRVAVGRQSVEILRLTNEVADLSGQLYDRRAENDRLASQARDLRATAGAIELALNDAFTQRDRVSAAREAAEARAVDLDGEASRLRARVAVAAARAEYLEARMEEAEKTARATRAKADRIAAELEVERGRAASLKARLDAATAERRGLSDRLSRSDGERRDFGVRVAELEERLRLSERAREETLIENGRQLAALGGRDAALAEASDKAAALDARLAALAPESRAFESASSPRADAELRKSVERLGREVSRLFAAQKASGLNESPGGDTKPSGGRAVGAALASLEGDAPVVLEGPRGRARRSRSTER